MSARARGVPVRRIGPNRRVLFRSLPGRIACLPLSIRLTGECGQAERRVRIRSGNSSPLHAQPCPQICAPQQLPPGHVPQAPHTINPEGGATWKRRLSHSIVRMTDRTGPSPAKNQEGELGIPPPFRILSGREELKSEVFVLAKQAKSTVSGILGNHILSSHFHHWSPTSDPAPSDLGLGEGLVKSGSERLRAGSPRRMTTFRLGGRREVA